MDARQKAIAALGRAIRQLENAIRHDDNVAAKYPKSKEGARAELRKADLATLRAFKAAIEGGQEYQPREGERCANVEITGRVLMIKLPPEGEK